MLGRDKGLADPKMTVFKEYLRTIWFGMYSRSRGVEGSSGIEHVYIGEMKHGISGLHSWVRFATEEKKGDINYLGFLSVIDLGEVGTIIFHFTFHLAELSLNLTFTHFYQMNFIILMIIYSIIFIIVLIACYLFSYQRLLLVSNANAKYKSITEYKYSSNSDKF